MSKDKRPLFMMAQLPFNRTEAVELNTYMTELMNDVDNSKISISNLKSLNIYEELLHKDATLLELGCGRGYMLEHLYQHTTSKNKNRFWGLEPIKSECDIAREKVKPLLPKAEDVLKNDILENVKFNEKFDYIYSYHVFEHIENPLDMLDFAKKYLKPSGKLIITCPNVEGYIPQKDIFKWRCAIVSHRWLPGKSTLSHALLTNGFQISKLFTYGGYPSPRSTWQNLMNQYFKWNHMGDVICIMAHLKDFKN